MAGQNRSSAIAILTVAGAAGFLAGVGSRTGGTDALAGAARRAGVASGVVRARAPQAGDHWGGCNDARAAGTAPIYRGEPGYRSDMDGDDDGIACEPHYN